jgi:O-antigen/teichoic acid export membrane protein
MKANVLSAIAHWKRLGRRLAGEASWLIFGQIMIISSGLALVVALTRLLGPERYGIFVLLNGLQTLALALSANATIQASMRLYANYRSGSAYQILRSESRRLLTICAGLSACGLAIAAFFQARGSPYLIALILVVLLGVDASRVYHTSMLNAARRHVTMIGWQTADTWLRTIGAVIAILISGKSEMAALGGLTIGAGLANLLFWRIAARIERETSQSGRAIHESVSDAGIRKEIRSHTWMMLPIGFVGWINGMGDRYIIDHLLSIQDVGIYSAALGLVSRPFRAMASLLDLLLRPRLYDAHAAKDAGKEHLIILSWTGAVLLAGGAASFAFWLLSEDLLKLLFGSPFATESRVTTWIAIAFVLFNLQLVFTRVCYAYKLSQTVLIIQAVPAACNIALCFLLIPIFGLIGAAYALAGSFAVQALISAAYAWRAVRSRGGTWQ